MENKSIKEYYGEFNKFENRISEIDSELEKYNEIKGMYFSNFFNLYKSFKTDVDIAVNDFISSKNEEEFKSKIQDIFFNYEKITFYRISVLGSGISIILSRENNENLKFCLYIPIKDIITAEEFDTKDFGKYHLYAIDPNNNENHFKIETSNSPATIGSSFKLYNASGFIDIIF